LNDSESTAQEALQQFRQRMTLLEDELREINMELGSQNLLALVTKTKELLRRTKGLLDGNIPILFAGQPPSVPEELYRHLEYAQAHITKALAEEYEFDTIKKRLYMATALAEFVIGGVAEAIKNLE
jgi:hypothetical protein